MSVIGLAIGSNDKCVCLIVKLFVLKFTVPSRGGYVHSIKLKDSGVWGIWLEN